MRNLLKKVSDVKQFIIESEMDNKIDPKDPYYGCIASLDDIIEKLIDQIKV